MDNALDDVACPRSLLDLVCVVDNAVDGVACFRSLLDWVCVVDDALVLTAYGNSKSTTTCLSVALSVGAGFLGEAAKLKDAVVYDGVGVIVAKFIEHLFQI